MATPDLTHLRARMKRELAAKRQELDARSPRSTPEPRGTLFADIPPCMRITPGATPVITPPATQAELEVMAEETACTCGMPTGERHRPWCATFGDLVPISSGP